MNSKLVKNLNVRPGTVIPRKETIEEMLLDVNLGNYLLGIIPKAQTTKAKMDKWVYIKIKALQSKGDF